MVRIPTLVRGVLAAAALGFVASLAGAQTYHQVIPGGDTVTGEVTSNSDVERFPFRLVEGTKLTLTVKAGKGSLLQPSLTLLDIDRTPDAGANAIVTANSKGTVVGLKNYVIPETGLRYIEIRGANGTTGTWTLTGKVTLTKGYAGTSNLAGGNAFTDVEFTSPGNATASFVVAAAKGSLALPELVSLKDPKNANITIDYDVPSKKGFGIKGVPLPEPGKHVLRVKSGVAGDFTVKVKWKVLKPVKKTITEDQVITDPVPKAVDPEAGDISDTIEVALSVDFAVQGAKVTFRKGTTAITVPASSIDVDGETASFGLVLSSFQRGTYDVEIENPDKGKGVLPSAFSVVLSPAQLTGVSPGYGFANQTAAVITINGKYMNTGATVDLVHDFEVINGTNVSGVSTALQATFDLTGHTWDFYDVVVANPGVLPTVLEDVFEIRNPLPIVSSITPNTGGGGVIACTITGAEFDPTPTVLLRKAGESDIPGTNVIYVNDTQVTASFDVAGVTPGSWDLVLTNPDLGEGSLSAAFGVSGPVGSPVQTLTAGYDFDAPLSVVYNAIRDEFAVAYVDENSTNFDVWLEVLDSQGAYTGQRVKVSNTASTAQKRDAVIAWDNSNNQYCVVWAEKAVNFNGATVSSIFARRVGATDLSLPSANPIKVGDHTLASGYYPDVYECHHPDICWDATNNVYFLIWTAEYNAAGDDYDMYQRTMSSADALGTPTGYVSGYHESAPTCAYDPVSGQVLVASLYRAGSTAMLSIRFVTTSIVTDTVSLKDPDLVVDTDTGRVILTWTRAPSSGLTVQGATYNGNSMIGNLVTIGQGNGDHGGVRKAYNSKSKETLFAWTRRDASGYLTVLTRRATTSGSGLTLIATEYEPSVGATDEATPFVGANKTSGQNVAFWLKTMTLFTSPNYVYVGSIVAGTFRGKQIWRQRYQ